MTELLEHNEPYLVERGAPVFSTAPNWPTEGKPAGRRLKLWHYKRQVYGDDVPTRVVWAGSGGYWRWVYE